MIMIVLYIYQHNGAVRKTNEDFFPGGITNSHWLRSGAGQTYSPLIGRWCPAPAAPYSRSRDFDQSSICLSQSAISDFNKKLAYSV